MKFSIVLTTLTLGLVGTACGGFTEVGQGAGGKGGSSGAANQGGSKPTAGSTGRGGSGGAGTAGDQGTANAPSTGGIAGSGGTNPCAGKACGETCFTCPPNQDCPAVDRYCDAQERCQLTQPECGTSVCKTDADCPAVELCAPCADDTCAEMRCSKGACALSCDSAGGGGTCAAEHASCANGETCCAGLECCAGVPVPPGNEYCGTVCPKSDVDIKRDFVSVDPDQILDKLSRLPVGVWSYRTEGSTQRHIGPMAQDFKASFGVGSSDRTILQVDADGVSFAAIQALNARLKAVEEQNQKLQRQLDEQRQRCER